jgi:hypothetical protein
MRPFRHLSAPRAARRAGPVCEAFQQDIATGLSQRPTLAAERGAPPAGYSACTSARVERLDAWPVCGPLWTRTAPSESRCPLGGLGTDLDPGAGGAARGGGELMLGVVAPAAARRIAVTSAVTPRPSLSLSRPPVEDAASNRDRRNHIRKLSNTRSWRKARGLFRNQFLMTKQQGARDSPAAARAPTTQTSRRAGLLRGRGSKQARAARVRGRETEERERERPGITSASRGPAVGHTLRERGEPYTAHDERETGPQEGLLLACAAGAPTPLALAAAGAKYAHDAHAHDANARPGPGPCARRAAGAG